MGKGKSFQQMVLTKLDSHMHKNQIEHLSFIISKINSKWFKNLNLICAAIKLTEKNWVKSS